jgi:hypothetical protein
VCERDFLAAGIIFSFSTLKSCIITPTVQMLALCHHLFCCCYDGGSKVDFTFLTSDWRSRLSLANDHAVPV